MESMIVMSKRARTAIIIRILAVSVLSVGLQACSSGTHGGPQILPTQSQQPITGRPSSPLDGNLSIGITIPAASIANAQNALIAQSTLRKPQYVSSSTKSITVSINGGTPVVLNTSAGSPGCTSNTGGDLTCTTIVTAPIGQDIFTEIAYDAINGSGDILSRSTTAQNILSGQTNTVHMVLNGVPASVAIIIQQIPVPVLGQSANFPVIITAKDASGSTIITDPYVSPITLSDSDTSGATKLSTTTVTSPSEIVTLAYTGATVAGAKISALTNGVAQNQITSATLYPRTTSTIDWNTWGFDDQRTGYNPHETTISSGNASVLKVKWSAKMPGGVNAQVMFANNVFTSLVGGGSYVDMVYAVDSAANVTALNAANGSVVWRKQLLVSLTTGACSTGYGINSAPTIDRATNRLYVADGQGYIYALTLDTGAAASGWPAKGVGVLSNAAAQYIWSAMHYIASSHRLYVGISSYGDCQPWQGLVTVLNTDTATIADSFITQQSPQFGAGVWGWGGVSVDPDNGDILAATGNAEPNESAPYSNAVLNLTPSLSIVSASPPVQSFTDSDYGASPVIYDDGGQCLALENKDGEFYIYNRANLAGGPTQALQILPGSDSGSGGVESPAYSPATHMLYVGNSNPQGSYPRGLLAFHIGSGCTVTPAWQTQFNPLGVGGDDNPAADPTAANGVVYDGDGGSGVLFAYNASSGAQLWSSSGVTNGSIYNSPAIANGRLYVGSGGGYVYSFGIE